MKTTDQKCAAFYKILYLCLILSTVASQIPECRAQISESTLGIKGGVNVLRLRLDEFENKENRVGYHFGAFSRIRISHVLALAPEVLFSTTATTLEYSINNTSNRLAIHLNYADVPLLANIYITERLTINGGAYFSYLLHTRQASGSSSSGTIEDPGISKSQFRNIDSGWIAGAGLEFRSLNAGIRYLRSFSTVAKQGQEVNHVVYNFPDGQRQVWQIFIGLSFF